MRHSLVFLLLFLLSSQSFADVNLSTSLGRLSSQIPLLTGPESPNLSKFARSIQVLATSNLFEEDKLLSSLINAAKTAKERTPPDVLAKIQTSVSTDLSDSLPQLEIILLALFVFFLVFKLMQTEQTRPPALKLTAENIREVPKQTFTRARRWIQEFQVWLSQRNVWELAMGVLVGGAFKPLVDSLVNDIISPIIAALLLSKSFENSFVVLKRGKNQSKYATLADATADGAVTLNYGKFITVIITFLVTAMVLFTLTKIKAKIDKHWEESQLKIQQALDEAAKKRAERDELRKTRSEPDLGKKSTK